MLDLTRKQTLAFLLLILVLGAALRLYPAVVVWHNLFSEPDVYIYYSVASQTLANHFIITSKLSGVPPRPYAEYPGLVLFPASISYLTGISVYSIIEFSPVLMGLLGIIAVYLLAYEFMKNHWMALFAAFLYSVLPATLYRSIAGEYRGEVFVPVFLAFAMLLLIKMNRKNMIWTVPSFIGLTALSIAWWSGGIYAVIAPTLFFISAAIFTYLPKVLPRTAYNPLLRNRITHMLIIILIAVAYPIAPIIPYLQKIAGFIQLQSQTSYIAELTPTSVTYILNYYAWVWVAAIMGLGLLIYYNKKETFYRSQYALFALFLPAIVMETIAIRWLILFSIPACIYGAYLIYALITVFQMHKQRAIIIVCGFAAIALVLGVHFVAILQPADFLNQQFISALSWMKNNTAANATVLTLWPDGSLVEGVADRASYTDSVMGLASWPPYVVEFEKMLYATAGNYSYIQSIKPSYLLVRRVWLKETVGILIQINKPLNTTYNGTDLQQLVNGTAPFPIVFRNNDSIIYKT